ncbi:MAG: sulfotransferase [Halioglobus sp.]
MSDINFDLPALLAEARQSAGLEDFGSEDFLPGLQSLLETYDSNNFVEASRKTLRKRMLDLLVSRLNVEAAWKRHPEVLDLPITRPLFLTGLPRTGTSALLNVLSKDPAARELKLWEAHNPSPVEGLAPGEEDPRYLQIKAYYDHMNATSDFKKIHYMTADSAEECIFLTNHTFQDAAYGFETFLEPYASFYREVDRRPQYQYHADLLRLLQWQRPADRWLLKTPSHICHLDIIAEQHPDCGMIVTHRNPLEVIGSYSSMMMAVLPEQTRSDPKDMGRRVLEHLAGQMDHCMATRETIDPERILDVQYVDFVDDTMAVVDEIYQHLSLPYGDEVRTGIKAYVDDHPRGKHGSHDYQLQEFGLTEHQVLDRFANYIETYNIAV